MQGKTPGFLPGAVFSVRCDWGHWPGAYAAANGAIDAFIHQQKSIGRGGLVSAVNWDACLAAESPETRGGWAVRLRPLPLTPIEVWAATERILTTAHPGQIAVSRGDLQARIDQWIHVQPQPQTVAAQPHSSTHTRPPAHYPLRPRLATRSSRPLRRFGKTCWGSSRVGIHDQLFFDLGGHSLLAIQAIFAPAGRHFPVAIEMRSLLFEAPTVAGIAAVIAAHPRPTPGNWMKWPPCWPKFKPCPARGDSAAVSPTERGISHDQPVSATLYPIPRTAGFVLSKSWRNGGVAVSPERQHPPASGYGASAPLLLPSSGCGSFSNSIRRTPPTTSPASCGCGGDSETFLCWSKLSMP